MSSLFGLNEFNELVHVSEVARGLACQCRCVVCHEPLVARQGTLRDHHFAHISQREACASSFESLLHRYAKQLLLQARALCVPVTPTIAGVLGAKGDGQPHVLHAAGGIQAEASLGRIRPDLLLTTGDGVLIAIEMAYSSFCDADKIQQFEQLGLPALEIDLSHLTPDGFAPEAVRHAVLDGLAHKRWVWPDMADSADPSTDQPAAMPQPDPRPAPSPLPQSRHLPEEIIRFSGRWVVVKQLPSGDIAVKVISWDPDLVSLVKSLAQAHGGYYNPRHKSWNVPRWGAGTVRHELRHKAQTWQLGFGPTTLAAGQSHLA